jgi:hypothetical protein
MYSSKGLRSDTVDVSLFVVDLLKEFFLEGLNRRDGAMLSNGFLKLAINLQLSKGNFLVSAVSEVEDASIIFVGVALPH